LALRPGTKLASYRFDLHPMCNLYSITTNQAAIIALFRIINRYVGNLPPMPGVFPDYPAPVVRNVGKDRELAMMRRGCRRHHGPGDDRGSPAGEYRTPS
jgi:putative SOS response-associated peptidase YedK